MKPETTPDKKPDDDFDWVWDTMCWLAIMAIFSQLAYCTVEPWINQ